ncbi:MAG: hypothetical protein LAO56_21975 [Acidobacteriia bacterium]|nr:hypothetical protein [Terriglobia bacterium]
MAELQTKEGELTSAQLATYGIESKQPDGPKLVEAHERETLDRAATTFGAHALVF